MNMQVHSAQQGSEQWLAERAERLNAGDAAAMLGCDVNGRTRTDLLDAMVKGYSPDVGNFKQKLYDKGHQVEALMRPLAEEIIGEDLYPLVGSVEVPGLSRRVGASFDGATIARDTNFEAKSLNEALAAALPREDDPDANDAANLPKGYRVQLEHQQLVDGATRTLFGAGEFNPDGSTKSQRWCWYESDPELRAEILAGWVQFEADLATHVPRVHQEAPRAEAIEALPMLVVQVEGRIVSSNLAVWREAALAKIAGINKDLKTDDDFAAAKEAVKWCDDSEKKLKLLKEQTLAQMVDVNDLVTTMDTIVAGLKRTRLNLDDLVSTRETAIRQEVARRGEVALAEYIAALNERIGTELMPSATSPHIEADFQKAIKSKRTVKSLNDSVDAELARCKIAASALADRIQKNRKFLDDQGSDHRNLFAGDERTLVLKDCDDFKAIATGRISEAKAAEQRRLDAERERIRQEEVARIEREQEAARQAELRREQEASEAQARQAAEAAKPAATPAPAPIVAPASLETVAAANSPIPASNVSTLRPVQPTAPPTMKLGDLNARLQHFSVNEAQLAALGFPATKVKGACLYHAHDLSRMLDSIVAHARMVQQSLREAA